MDACSTVNRGHVERVSESVGKQRWICLSPQRSIPVFHTDKCLCNAACRSTESGFNNFTMSKNSPQIFVEHTLRNFSFGLSHIGAELHPRDSFDLVYIDDIAMQNDNEEKVQSSLNCLAIDEPKW